MLYRAHFACIIPHCFSYNLFTVLLTTPRCTVFTSQFSLNLIPHTLCTLRTLCTLCLAFPLLIPVSDHYYSRLKLLVLLYHCTPTVVSPVIHTTELSHLPLVLHVNTPLCNLKFNINPCFQSTISSHRYLNLYILLLVSLWFVIGIHSLILIQCK